MGFDLQSQVNQSSDDGSESETNEDKNKFVNLNSDLSSLEASNSETHDFSTIFKQLLNA